MTNQVAKKSVYLHEVFGIANPIRGFENPLKIDAVPQAFVPEINPDYVFEADMVSRVMRSYAARENILLTGEKGSGKTTFVQQFCARLNIPLMTINGGPALDETYLMGTKTLKGGDVQDVDGVLSYCLRHGIAILIDEFASIKPSVLLSINDVLNGDSVITLKHHGLDPKMAPSSLAEIEGGMSIQRHKRFRLFACDNTGGKMARDPRFAGTFTQNSAVRSRFTCFNMAFMKPALELKALVKATGGKLPTQVGKYMVELGIRVRASFSQGEMSDTISFRELLRWARKSLVYATIETVKGSPEPIVVVDTEKSFIDAIYTGMEEDDQAVVRELFELVIGSPLSLTDEYLNTPQSFLVSLEKGTLAWDEEM